MIVMPAITTTKYQSYLVHEIEKLRNACDVIKVRYRFLLLIVCISDTGFPYHMPDQEGARALRSALIRQSICFVDTRLESGHKHTGNITSHLKVARNC